MNRCFVIGPIGNKFAEVGTPDRDRFEESLEVYEKVIRPACSQNGLDPVRADQIAVSGEITDQIFRHLFEDEVVIADLSWANANVMYELGLRHSRDLLTIQIGEYGLLPFDVKTVRTIQFSRSEHGLIEARKALSLSLTVGLSEGGDPVSATRIWKGGTARNSLETSSDPLPPGASESDPDDDPGIVERMAELEGSFPKLTTSLEEIGEILERLAAEAQDSAGEVTQLNSAGSDAKTRLKTVTRFASRLQPLANELTKSTGDFVEEMRRINSSVGGVLTYLEAHPDGESPEDLAAFIAGIITTAQYSRDAMESVAPFANVVGSLGQISRALARPGRQVRDALTAIAEAASVMDEWHSAAIRLQRRINAADDE